MSADLATTKTVAIAGLPKVRSDTFVSCYVNHTEAASGFYELGMVFCRIAKNAQGELGVEQEVEVILTWEHAVRVRDLLDRLTKGYEVQHGPIRLFSEGEPPERAQQPEP